MEPGKDIICCVTGGHLAYRCNALASMLVKTGYDVKVVMTRNDKREFYQSKLNYLRR